MKDASGNDILTLLKNIEWDVSQIKLSTKRMEERLTIMDCHQVAFHSGISGYANELTDLRERVQFLESKARPGPDKEK